MASTLDEFRFSLSNDPKPLERYVPAQRRINASRTGKLFTLVRGDVLRFAAKFTVAFPQPPSTVKTLTDMIAFIDGHKALSFLFMPYSGPSLRKEDTSSVAIAAQTVFAFKHKHLDSSTVKVYVDTVLQTSGYTFSGNNTAPIVTFSVAPGVGKVVRLVALFFVPVVFRETPLEDGEGLADPRDAEVDAPMAFSFDIIEIEPGARFVTATGQSGA
jgi:hypothetical protein